MAARRILVTPRSVTRDGHPSLEKLRAAGCELVFSAAGQLPSEDELCRLVLGCVGWLAGVESATERVFGAADALKVISRNGTGVDNIDLVAAQNRGITVLRAEGANARGVAELAIAQILNLARRIPACDAALKLGAWDRGVPGMEVEGRTLGLIGCGQVGRLVACMALGLGINVLAHDPIPKANFSPGAGFQFVSFNEALAAADFVSLHCPPRADGVPLLDAAALASMKRGARLINTARHELYDPDALLVALDSGQLAGVALDVFDAEPPLDRRLAEHPKVIATPHVGGFTRESIDRAMHAAVDNLLAALAQLD